MDDPSTERQQKAIWSYAASLRLSPEEMNAMSRAQHGVPVERLTRREASFLIDHLRQQFSPADRLSGKGE